MPRGFLVKRTKKIHVAQSYRERHGSNEDDNKSDSGSEVDYSTHTRFGSPDSGYASSPLNLQMYRETENNLNNNVLSQTDKESVSSVSLSTSSTPASSPLSLGTIGSPFQYNNFDRLSVSSPTGKITRDFQGHFPYFSQHIREGLFMNGNLLTKGIIKSEPNVKKESFATSPGKKRNHPDSEVKVKTPKKPKAARKISFIENNSSPVSGTIIKDPNDQSNKNSTTVCGDIDSSLNFVEVTPEARAELEKIENKIGDYVCMLCKEHYDDAFQLAQHRCSRIIHVEYRCPECDKVFNCPANLASHRRWHKPRPNKNSSTTTNKIIPAVGTSQTTTMRNNLDTTIATSDGELYHSDSETSRFTPSPASSQGEEGKFECDTCHKKFRRQGYLKKHMTTHNEDQMFPCHLCDKVFRNEAARVKHVFQHNGAPPKDVACPICNICLPNKASLERHMKMHTSETFSCKYCSSTFYSSPGLTRHINKCHPSENRQVILLQLPPVNRPC